jgi:hypothetical protein
MSNSRFLLAIVTLCSACGGSSFDAGGTAGSSGSATEAGATGSNAGATSGAGASSGGADTGDAGAGGLSAGGAATAGAGGSSAGGSSAGAGGSSAGGRSGGAGAGGSGTGGRSGGAGAGGSGGAADCATLKTEYTAALEKARVCDKGSTDQCTTSSTLPTMGCGCPTLVNAKSEATTLAKEKYQAFQNAKCPIGPICAIACLAYTGATCSAQTTGTGNTFVCTGSQGVATK